MVETKNKTIELWDGYEVEVNERLFDDTDFLSDFSKATHDNDIEEIMAMLFAVVGGQDVYDAARERIEKEYGYFSIKALREITDKIEGCFPKAGNRASRRQKWTRK